MAENGQPFRNGEYVPHIAYELELVESDSEPPDLQAQHASNYEDTPITDDEDREVARTTRKRRRRRGHGWSKPKGSNSSRLRSRSRSYFSDSGASKTSYYSEATYYTDFASDFSDAEGLLVEHGVRTDDEISNVTTKRKRKARRRKWTRQKGSYRSRSHTPGTVYSQTSRKTVVSPTVRENRRVKKTMLEARSKSVRLKNMFNDILAIKDNFRQFTEAYLVQEMECYEFYESDDESQMIPIIKTRCAHKMREEVMKAFKFNVYDCPECVACFLVPDEATKHMVDEHKAMPLYSCSECTLRVTFATQDHYEVHKEVHDKAFKGYCLFCSREFTHRKQYYEHMDQYLSYPNRCVYCGNIYLDKYAYQSHVRKRHKGMKYDRKRPISCIIERIDYGKYGAQLPQPYGEFCQVRIQIPIPERSSSNSPAPDSDEDGTNVR